MPGMARRHAWQHKPRYKRIAQKGEEQQHQRRQLHPVIRRTYAASRANGLLRQDLETAMLAVHLALFSSPEDTPPQCAKPTLGFCGKLLAGGTVSGQLRRDLCWMHRCRTGRKFEV